MKYTTLLMAGILSTTIVGCSDTKNTTSEPSPKETTEKKPDLDSNLPTYKVGTVYNYPPFAESDVNGKSAGFDIDLMNAIADTQGFNVNYMPVDWKNCQKDLASGKVDIWAAGIAIEEDRKEFTSFSNAYLSYHTVAMVLDTDKTKSIDIKNLSEIHLSAEKSTVDYDLAVKIAGDADKVTKLDSDFKGLQLLIQGKVDAVIGNNLVLSNHATAYPEIKTRLVLIDKEENQDKKELGFMMKKDRAELVESVNEGLEKVKADGTYAEITKKWFGDNVE